MGTTLQTVHDAFLAKITSDEWFVEGEFEAVSADWRMLLEGAIFRFRYPRISLEIRAGQFVENLTNDEIQVLATYMKLGWVQRAIADINNLNPLFLDKDFSPAHFLARLLDYQIITEQEAKMAADTYDRSRSKQPFDFSRLAGKKR